MTSLAKAAPTLARYTLLDCGLVHIGKRWIVFFDGTFHDEVPFPDRLAALDYLREVARERECPMRRAVEANEAAVRG